MKMLGAAIEYLWTALFTVAMLAAVAGLLATAWTGKFWFGRIRRDGRRWPPHRSEAPVKFWLVWMLYGGPLIILTMLALLGVVGSLADGG